GVRAGGDVGQFGDDFLLLGQIESHNTPPYELRSRLLPLAVLGGALPCAPGMARGIPVLAFLTRTPEGSVGRENFQKAAPSTQARSRGTGLSNPAASTAIPCHSEHPCPSSMCAVRTCGLCRLSAHAGTDCPQKPPRTLPARGG